ncbi:MAG TPA: SRPBCC domain-containing protein [Edaphobacter sp.]|jgi:uncharacterized protein YndB with AHSA1/START domain
MTENFSTRTSRIIQASPEALYNAFLDPEVLVTWLPPAQMTGKIHHFDGRPGGGYSMSLFYPLNEQRFRGKTSDKEDRVNVRFLELVVPSKIVEGIRFVTDDSGLEGEMTMVASFEQLPSGTEVILLFSNLPPGLRPEDNAKGAEISLHQLAQRFESFTEANDR